MSEYTEVLEKTAIVQLLNDLVRNREIVNVMSNVGRVGMATVLLEVAPKSDLLYFDASPDDGLNTAIKSTSKLIFTGSSRGVKLEFSVTGIRAVQHKGAAAFSARMPNAIKHFQPRESFRVRATKTTYCVLPTRAGAKVRAPIAEISSGGLRVLLNHDMTYFSPDQVLKDCYVDLGEQGRVECTLEVRNLKELSIGGKRYLAMGCRFVGLAASLEARISRYVTQLEVRSSR